MVALLKIMIVDDEKPIRQWFRFCLEKNPGDYQIVGEASNGQEALNTFEKARPDLVITDIKMPVMDGIELIKRLKVLAPETDIVILTCYTEFSLAREAIKLGAFDFIPKVEVQDKDILELLERLERKRRGQISKIPGLQDAFLLLDPIKDEVNQVELVDELKQAGINFTCQTYAVIAVRLAQKLVELDNSVFEQEIREGKFFRIKSAINQWWLLGMMSHNVNSWETSQFVDKLQERLDCAVGISQSYTDPGHLQKAFREAFGAMKHRFFQGRSRLVILDNIEREGEWSDLQNKIADLKKDLLHQVNQENGAEILKYIASIMDCFTNGPEADLRYLSQVCSEILELLSAKVRLAGYGDQLTGMNSESLMEQKGFFEDLRQGMLEISERLVKLTAVPQNKYSSIVQATLRYIGEHYYEGISLHEIASNVHVNSNYLCQLFKNETGENFSLYLTELRLEKAKKLLSSSDLKLYEIAEQVGYPNISYFSRIFKKFTGKTPFDYRNTIRATKYK
ncbi:MAG TPA: hypothetical protein DDW50_14575 [Firmicutes bacterium]|jgi:two-component system, response regulator YesN|nr:hypothetical protein [Bacillota bacterium]